VVHGRGSYRSAFPGTDAGAGGRRHGHVRAGRAQRDGGPIEEIRAGDVVWFAPGEKHWHGASPTTAMTHIAVQESLDGKIVDWMEQVTDEQYETSHA
jgi:oxalate decarboxylase/phosphoglucose isomerase-like protein (cupin superfamily)